MKETTVAVSQVSDCGIGGRPLLAALPTVEQRNGVCRGPANIGPWIGWFVSVTLSRFDSDFPWPEMLAESLLGPSGRPLTTPSGWWLPSGSGANEPVTSPPPSSIWTSASAVLA